jgi:hypothetical protein
LDLENSTLRTQPKELSELASFTLRPENREENILDPAVYHASHLILPSIMLPLLSGSIWVNFNASGSFLAGEDVD